MAPRSARLAERRRASSWSSMRSTATLVSRTIWVSTSPWSRNRWISNRRVNGRFAMLHRRAQLVHRAQWLRSCTDQQSATGADPQGGDVRRDQAEVEDHVVDHCQQRRVDMFDARRARPFAQAFEEILRQFQMPLHPAFAGGMGEVQVQPEELVRLLLGACRRQARAVAESISRPASPGRKRKP